MGIRPSGGTYGTFSIALHWAMAALIFAMFILGEYMTGLEYYHPWYHAAPALHKSLGVVVASLLVVRLVWRLGWSRAGLWPAPVPMPAWERTAAATVHRLFYLLLFVVVICGYLIPTAEGKGVEVFGLFEVPAVVYGFEGQEDIAGELHEIAAWAVIVLSMLHAAAAMKHHFIDRDVTLLRMFGLGQDNMGNKNI